jgi:hypothetical protein
MLTRSLTLGIALMLGFAGCGTVNDVRVNKELQETLVEGSDVDAGWCTVNIWRPRLRLLRDNPSPGVVLLKELDLGLGVPMHDEFSFGSYSSTGPVAFADAQNKLAKRTTKVRVAEQKDSNHGASALRSIIEIEDKDLHKRQIWMVWEGTNGKGTNYRILGIYRPPFWAADNWEKFQRECDADFENLLGRVKVKQT